jgi:LysR family transcriptional regulator for bpeEF and oprC
MDPDLFRGVVPFVTVAETGSVRAAGARLGVSGAAISKAIQVLEREAGVKLFVRGARSLSLTTEGEAFLAACRPAVLAVDAGRAALESGRIEVLGELVISAPFVAASLLAGAVRLLRERHTALRVTLRITDRLARLGEEGVDIGVRIGRLEASALVARRLRATRLVTVASPSYLARAGHPAVPAALGKHDTIVVIAPDGRPFEWRFRGGTVAVSGRLHVDHGPSVLHAVLGGLGVGQLFDWMAEPHLRDGSLVEVFADLVAPGPDVWAVCAPGRQATARVRAGLDALAEGFGG